MRQWTDGDGRQWRGNEAGGYIALVRLELNGKWLGCDSHEDKKALWAEIRRLDSEIEYSRAVNAEIHTNHRGYIAVGEHRGEAIDGHFDGYAWHAWSGSHIAYGATEAQAIEHLKEKLR